MFFFLYINIRATRPINVIYDVCKGEGCTRQGKARRRQNTWTVRAGTDMEIGLRGGHSILVDFHDTGRRQRTSKKMRTRDTVRGPVIIHRGSNANVRLLFDTINPDAFVPEARVFYVDYRRTISSRSRQARDKKHTIASRKLSLRSGTGLRVSRHSGVLLILRTFVRVKLKFFFLGM